MFKVGDWVRTTIYGVQKVIGFDGERYTVTGSISNLRPIDCSLWQPKEGEWVITPMNDNCFQVHTYDPHFSYSWEVQPFIGELPEYIRSKNV